MTIIAFEGPDKLGKSTQAKKLVEALTNTGKKSIYVKIPFNDGVLFKLIYWMLGNGFAKRFPNSFQLVQHINKLIFQLIFLPILRRRYNFVVLDRWAPSAVIYGTQEGVPHWFSMLTYKLFIVPDATLVFTGTQFETQTQDDSYEKDAVLQRRVGEAYDLWAASHDKTVLVDNAGGIEHVHGKVIGVLGPNGLNVL